MNVKQSTVPTIPSNATAEVQSSGVQNNKPFTPATTLVQQNPSLSVSFQTMPSAHQTMPPITTASGKIQTVTLQPAVASVKQDISRLPQASVSTEKVMFHQSDSSASLSNKTPLAAGVPSQTLPPVSVAVIPVGAGKLGVH